LISSLLLKVELLLNKKGLKALPVVSSEAASINLVSQTPSSGLDFSKSKPLRKGFCAGMNKVLFAERSASCVGRGPDAAGEVEILTGHEFMVWGFDMSESLDLQDAVGRFLKTIGRYSFAHPLKKSSAWLTRCSGW
jgi:hypothetical protein